MLKKIYSTLSEPRFITGATITAYLIVILLAVSSEGRLYRNDHTGPNGWKPGTTGLQWTGIGPA